MHSFKRLFPIFFLLLLVQTGQADVYAQNKQKIALFDLGYTLKPDMKNEANVHMAWDHAHTLATLQGIVNRKSPRLYLFFIENAGVNIDRYWWDKYRKPGKWLHNADTLLYTDLIKLIGSFKQDIKGAVVYDPKVPATSNVASSVAGADELIAIRYDLSEGSLYRRLVLEGPKIPVKKWLLKPDGASLFTGKGFVPDTKRPSSGSAKNDAYLWFIENYIKTGKCNTAYGAYYLDQQWMQKPTATRINHHTLSNHDFFVSKNAFFYDLSPWGDERATDDKAQQQGTDLNTLKELLLLAYQRNGNGKRFTYLGGFPPWAYKYTKHAGGKHEDVETEWEYSRVISAYNAFKDADAIGFGALANASFWQHYPLKKTYKQDWVTQDELKKKGYLDANGKLQLKDKNYYIFYVGDYDASSWLSQTTPDIWDSPDRGKVPLMWSISPVLAQRVPMAMEYRRETATPNDYFAAADNGSGYLMPGMLQAPRAISGLPDAVEQWAGHNAPYYKQWGLSITGFVIDGLAPAMNSRGLDAYAKFSPNGIVPQKVPLTSLHGNMPVLRAGEDVNQDNPAEAARIIVDQIHKRNIPFHWFRNILKVPSWHVKVVEEVKKLDPKAELLDAPTFFELYRTYLKENPQAAAGKAPFN
ncbi:GxGYxYP domain-containing protein [Pedobacter ginsengisoli]|uniref:GxGYxYP domain-containing protein n=1 Tax=Pedobacter ginsengisoli TaxID=363852 RepID=UPI00254F163A|nr:GxGYxYP domain-containing protein [Pedobacter ginsengisoli]